MVSDSSSVKVFDLDDDWCKDACRNAFFFFYPKTRSRDLCLQNYRVRCNANCSF